MNGYFQANSTPSFDVRSRQNVEFPRNSASHAVEMIEGGPFKLLIQNELHVSKCHYEPEGRGFESLRAHQFVPTVVIISPDRETRSEHDLIE